MIVLVALLSVAAFLAAFSLSVIVRVASPAVEIARDAVGMQMRRQYALAAAEDRLGYVRQWTL